MVIIFAIRVLFGHFL